MGRHDLDLDIVIRLADWRDAVPGPRAVPAAEDLFLALRCLEDRVRLLEMCLARDTDDTPDRLPAPGPRPGPVRLGRRGSLVALLRRLYRGSRLRLRLRLGDRMPLRRAVGSGPLPSDTTGTSVP